MQYEVEVNGRACQVHVHRHGGQFSVSVDGREWMVDAARIDSHLVSLLVARHVPEPEGSEPAASHEVAITTDPSGQMTVLTRGIPVVAALNSRRRWGRRDEGPAGSGPQKIVAPMPGKIVRVPVKRGDAVQPKQSLVVVEAMKMENDLRAAHGGVVAEILVEEGQSVEAGAVLLVIHPA